jgi:CubicO group peptidase (beta-lactamase class C family)
MKKRISLLLMLLLSLAISIVNAQQSIQKKLKGFDAYVEQAMKDWKVPGLAIAIVQDTSIVFAKGYGYRDVENKKPVTENTLFAIGSCTKAFTAAAIGKLVDDGIVDLDEPVIRYLPDFRMYDDYVTMHLTVRDLYVYQSNTETQRF